MDILSGLKKDLEKGIKQGVDAVKSTATLVKEKAEEITEKGKIQYRIFEMKSRLQKQFASLGTKLHELTDAKKVNVSNQDLKKLLTAIDKTKAAIAKLGEASRAMATAARKPASRRTAVKKQKPAVKKESPKKVKAKGPAPV